MKVASKYVLGVVAALALAGCGGAPEGSSEGSEPTVESAAPVAAADAPDEVAEGSPAPGEEAPNAISGHNPSTYKLGWFKYQSWDKLCGWKGPVRLTRSGADLDGHNHFAKYL